MVAPASSAENNAGQSERSGLPTSSSNETGTLVQALSSEPTPPPPELPACVRELGEEVWATASGGHNSPVSSVWKDQEAAADLLRAVTAAAEANPVSFEHWVLLCAATAMFEREFLNGDNILSRAQASVQQLDVVAVYNWARKAALTPHPAMAGAPAELVAAAEDATSLLADLPTSALVEGARRGDARLAVQFGGQGVDYLQELRDAYATFPAAREVIEHTAAALATEASTKHYSEFYPDGFEVLGWIMGTAESASAPDVDTLNRAPVSFPLIGLTQLANYAAGVQCTGATVADFASLVRAATGHSQGLASAIAISRATDEASFLAAALDTVLFLQSMGCRCQQVTDALLAKTAGLPVPPRPKGTFKVKGTPEKPVDEPTTMLAVLGISTAKTAEMIEIFVVTRKIPAVLRPVLSLVNGPTASVVTGVPTLLTEFRAMLGEVRATPGEQEPRVPYSQRKLPVRTRFLSTSAPFHNVSLEPAVGLVEADLPRLGIVAPAASLRIPVLSTLDGTPLSTKDEIGGSVLPAVARLICAAPLDWIRAVNATVATAGATHVLDFGPGTVQGSAGLTGAYLQGSGVHTVMSTAASLTFVAPPLSF